MLPTFLGSDETGHSVFAVVFCYSGEIVYLMYVSYMNSLELVLDNVS